MAKKPKSESSIELRDLFNAVNRKDRGWWDRLTKPQQDKFGSWLYSRYISSSRNNIPDMQRYFVMAENRAVNKHFNTIFKDHKKLQYLLMTTVPAHGITSDYQYIKPLPQTRKQNQAIKTLLKLYPSEKIEDLETLSDMLSPADLKKLLVDHGWDDKAIKQELKK